MKLPATTLELRTSPHERSGRGVESIMRNVAGALVPVCLFAVYVFGLSTVLVLLVSVATCLATEKLLSRGEERRTLADGSVMVTGLLYGLTLPPGLALWMTALGAVVAVAVGKMLFGGLGYNLFNPALVGRAFLQAAFPTAMTSWTAPFLAGRFAAVPSSTLAWPFSLPAYSGPFYDGLSGATPLAAWKFAGHEAATSDLVMGLTAGSTGETSAILILLGGLWLVGRKMMSWRIPASIFATVALLSALLNAASPERYPSAALMLTAGGLMLGAVFMATDMVASPMTPAGLWLYGALIGTLVVVIRLWAGMPEGVMYAILLGNAASPLIDRLLKSRPFGTRTARDLARDLAGNSADSAGKVAS